MNKPPAFQFYPDDFIGGTAKFTDAELGLYIRLLCAQWSEGGLTDDDNDLASYGKGGTPIDRVKQKFQKCEDGKLRQHRLEQEREKQRIYRESRAANGKNGGRPVKPHANHMVSIPKPQHKAYESSPSPSPSPIAERESSERPGQGEVEAYADTIGLAKWKALDWFQEMEACGWLDHNGREVLKWQPMLSRIKTKWEADGRPSAPPTSRGYAGTGGQSDSVFAITKKLEEVRKAKQRAKDKAAPDPLGSLTFRNEADKAEFKRLVALEKELAAKLTT